MARAVTCFWKANTHSATQEISHPSWNQTDYKLGPSISASPKCHFPSSSMVLQPDVGPRPPLSSPFRSQYIFALVFIGQNIVLSTLFSSYLPNPQVKPYKTARNIIIWRLQSSDFWRNVVWWMITNVSEIQVLGVWTAPEILLKSNSHLAKYICPYI
jgi:hypothetical protein